MHELVQTFHLLKAFYYDKDNSGLPSSCIRQEWEHFSSKGPAAPPQFPYVYRLMLKAEEMLRRSKQLLGGVMLSSVQNDFLIMAHFLSLNIWYFFYFLLWNMFTIFTNHFILFLFTSKSKLFGNLRSFILFCSLFLKKVSHFSCHDTMITTPCFPR